MGGKLTRKRVTSCTEPNIIREENKEPVFFNDLTSNLSNESHKKKYIHVFETQSPASSATSPEKINKKEVAKGFYQRSRKKNPTVSFSIKNQVSGFDEDIQSNRKISDQNDYVPKRRDSNLLARRFLQNTKSASDLSSQGDLIQTPEAVSSEPNDVFSMRTANGISRGERVKSIFSLSEKGNNTSITQSAKTMPLISVDTNSTANSQNSAPFSQRNGVLLSEETFFANKGEPAGLKIKSISSVNLKGLGYLNKYNKKKDKAEAQNSRNTISFSEYLEDLKMKSKIERVDSATRMSHNEEKKNLIINTPLLGKRGGNTSFNSQNENTNSVKRKKLKQLTLDMQKIRKAQDARESDIFNMQNKITREYLKIQKEKSEESKYRNSEYGFFEPKDTQSKERALFTAKQIKQTFKNDDFDVSAPEENGKSNKNNPGLRTYSDFEALDIERLNELVKSPAKNVVEEKVQKQKDSRPIINTKKRSKIEVVYEDKFKDIPSENLLAVLISNNINPTNYFLGNKSLILKSIQKGQSQTPKATLSPKLKEGSLINSPAYLSSRREKQMAVLQIQESNYFKMPEFSTKTPKETKRPIHLKIDTFLDEKRGSNDLSNSLASSMKNIPIEHSRFSFPQEEVSGLDNPQAIKTQSPYLINKRNSIFENLASKNGGGGNESVRTQSPKIINNKRGSIFDGATVGKPIMYNEGDKSTKSQRAVFKRSNFNSEKMYQLTPN